MVAPIERSQFFFFSRASASCNLLAPAALPAGEEMHLEFSIDGHAPTEQLHSQIKEVCSRLVAGWDGLDEDHIEVGG
jgi:hypothetical protein